MFVLLLFRTVGIVSKEKIKKQLRNVIYVEEDDGNLAKYVRVHAKQSEKPNRHVKASLRKPISPKAKPTRMPAPRQNAPKRSKCNGIATLLPAKSPVRSNTRKRNAKVTPATVRAPLLPYEIEATKSCSVVLTSMTENDIAEVAERLKHQCVLDEPQLQEENGSESATDGSLQLMQQCSTKDSNDISITASGGFVICLPDVGNIVISMPMLKNCALNPLHDLMFILGEAWSIDLQGDGSLSFTLPEVDGKRETFVFSERVWTTWLGIDEQMHARSSFESRSIQNQSAEGNVTINSNNSLLLMSTSEIAKLLGDDDILAVYSSMDWKFDPQVYMSIGGVAIDSLCEQFEPTIIDQTLFSSHDEYDEEGTDGYDASIEVGRNQFIHSFIHFDTNMMFNLLDNFFYFQASDDESGE